MTLPAPTILDPASVPALRWAVIGPGDIASVFVAAIHEHTAQRCVAVASRTPGKAQTFAEAHDVAHVAANYESLVALPEVDVVYVSSHVADHMKHALLAIAAGKHVLVEKPIALTAADAEEILAAGVAAGVLVMEAMWTRYLPQSTIIRSLMDEGSLGAPELFTAEFCSDLRWLDRLWVVNGGGAAFDLGIYPVAMAQQFLGNPTSIKATGQTHASGANEEVQVNLGYSSGARASILISGIASTLHRAACCFDKGIVALDAPFFVPSGISLMGKDIYDEAEHWTDDTAVQRHHGLSYQATWLAHFVSEGLLESPVHTHADVVANIRVLEEIVTQVEG